MVRKYLPESNIEMVTNGDPLNLKRLKKLFEHGLNKILISSYDGKEESEKLEDLCIQANLNEEQWTNMSKSCYEWYQRNVHSKNCWKNMVENILYH